jgi:hypothetical protein
MRDLLSTAVRSTVPAIVRIVKLDIAPHWHHGVLTQVNACALRLPRWRQLRRSRGSRSRNPRRSDWQVRRSILLSVTYALTRRCSVVGTLVVGRRQLSDPFNSLKGCSRDKQVSDRSDRRHSFVRLSIDRAAIHAASIMNAAKNSASASMPCSGSTCATY